MASQERCSGAPGTVQAHPGRASIRGSGRWSPLNGPPHPDVLGPTETDNGARIGGHVVHATSWGAGSR